MAGKRVLVVDDEQNVRDLTKALLQRMGFTVQTAASGPEALQLFQPGTFDLVVTDLHMPEMSGTQLAARIHQQEASLPVVLITGGALESPVSHFKEVLRKPFSAAELREVVGRALGQER